MLKVVSNKIRCKWCGDILESFTVHDFKRCKCGKCFTDGGLEYVRRGFDGDNPDDVYEDLSVYYDPETKRSVTASEAKAMDIPDGSEVNPPTIATAPPPPPQDIPEVTEESKDDEPLKKKPIRGRYDFNTGEAITEHYD